MPVHKAKQGAWRKKAKPSQMRALRLVGGQKAALLNRSKRRWGGLRALLSQRNEEDSMPQEDHIYRVIELAGTSDKSIEDP